MSDGDADLGRSLSTELAPSYAGSPISEVENSAQESFSEGVVQGVISPESVEFAQALLPEESREAAILLPLYNLMARHAVLRAAEDDETRSESVYGVNVDEVGSNDVKVISWSWKKLPGIGNTYEYRADDTIQGVLSIRSPFLVASSPEELEQIIAWKRIQAARLEKVEKEGPLGRASALVASAYGGIDITNPERAIRELGIRSLTAAVIAKQHKSGSFDPSEVLEPRLRMLFGKVTDVHSQGYREFTDKVDSAATMATVAGSIEAARINVVASMIHDDTARFLEQVWTDLERVVAVERLGRYRIVQLAKLIER